MRVVNFLPELVSNYTKEAFLFIAMKNLPLLKFHDSEIIYSVIDGVYWIALKPVLDSLNIESDSLIRKTKKDSFLGSWTVAMTVQVAKNGQKQGRLMVCLPEKYIYGWLGFLTVDNPILNAYKEEMYELIYNHFKGSILNRKEILEDINSETERIYQLEQELKKNAIVKEVNDLKLRIKKMNKDLKLMDKSLVKPLQLFK